MTTADKIRNLEIKITSMRLRNDARYWDLRRTYGDISLEVLRHLESCAEHQRRATPR